MNCKFLETLRRLQKHSAESVDYLGQFSEQSSYLHVDRPIQQDLIELLERAANSDQKSLVLLCGSAGDGKSHMLSYLLHGDHKELIDSFKVRNDATESDAPHRTAPETLADALIPFCDEFLDDGGSEKFVVAINLGLLSRFLESDSGRHYSALREYVDQIGVLRAELSNTDNGTSPFFYAIDFSDYQLFTIEDGLIKTDFFDSILDKVFAPIEDNPFYASCVNSCSACPADKSICPVRHNYAYLQQDEVQANVSRLLVEIALRERCVITARAALDYIFDILVAPDFDIAKLSELNTSDPNAFAFKYLQMTTPQLVYSSTATNQLIEKTKQLDPISDDQGKVDELAVRFQASSKFLEEMLPVIADSPYLNVFTSCSGFFPESLKNDRGQAGGIKTSILRFFVRCSYLTGKIDAICDGYKRPECVDEFADLIYRFNTGDENGLKHLKKNLLSKAIEDWNGDYPSGYSLVKTYGDVQILQEIKTVFGSSSNAVAQGNMLTRFRPYVLVRASLVDKKKGPFVDFQVDYNLYLLLKRMEAGYQPTLMDKNLFSGFENSYERLLSQGDKGREVFVARRSKGKQPFLEMNLDEDEEFSVEEC